MGQAKNRGTLAQRVAQAEERIAGERQEQRMREYRQKAARDAERRAVEAAKDQGKPRPRTPLMDRESRRLRSSLLLASVVAILATK